MLFWGFLRFIFCSQQPTVHIPPLFSTQSTLEIYASFLKFNFTFNQCSTASKSHSGSFSMREPGPVVSNIESESRVKDRGTKKRHLLQSDQPQKHKKNKSQTWFSAKRGPANDHKISSQWLKWVPILLSVTFQPEPGVLEQFFEIVH